MDWLSAIDDVKLQVISSDPGLAVGSERAVIGGWIELDNPWIDDGGRLGGGRRRKETKDQGRERGARI